ncbi:hypothetical protein [Proteus mirabilis]|uniref:hypothetical protein n=1 Tax=Proteus mirabilis TaxID=584 RepID=UPI003BF86880
MDKSRQQFEEAIKNGFNTKHLSLEPQREGGCGYYRWGETERCWEMWQASRKSLEVELPEPFIANENCETWCYDEDLVNQALISNGVKIKNE